MSYLVECGRSALKGVAINRQETQKIGIARLHHLGMGAWLTPKTSPLLICVTTSNLVVLRQIVYA